jgi:hypothetical protein
MGGDELSIAVNIARYTATGAAAEGLALGFAPAAKCAGPTLIERLSKLLEHLCAFWSSAATDSAVGPRRSTCPIVVTTSPSPTT